MLVHLTIQFRGIYVTSVDMSTLQDFSGMRLPFQCWRWHVHKYTKGLNKQEKTNDPLDTKWFNQGDAESINNFECAMPEVLVVRVRPLYTEQTEWISTRLVQFMINSQGLAN